jgi:hypothetical protein
MKSMLKQIALAALVGTFMAGTLKAQDAQDAPTVLGPSGNEVYVKIEQSADLTGELLEMDALKVTTSFGDVAIPMDNIEGIRMNIGSDGKAVIAFKNGDMVTGNVNLDALVLKTNWGKAHIDSIHIEAVTMSKDGRFFKDGADGTGAWRFSKAVDLPATASGRTNSRTSVNPTTLPRQFGQ